MDPEQSIRTLTKCIDALDESSQGFAKSLLKQHDRDGSLSHKQWYWVGELVKRAAAAAAPRPKVGKLDKIVALFERARRHLKHPFVVLMIGDDNDVEEPISVRLSLAGAKSREPGSINVAEDGRWGERMYFGRIKTDGTFAAAGAPPEGLLDLLADFAKRPAEVASEHGKLRGHCVFCSRKLNDDRSLAVGYGRDCASHWGLPWGAREPAPSARSDASRRRKPSRGR
ncbi:MAG: DUF6011 domain-containing protein [Bacteroidota bacterium]